jgi:hypothetical protein
LKKTFIFHHFCLTVFFPLQLLNTWGILGVKRNDKMLASTTPIILLKVALNTINQAKPYCDVHTVYGSPSNWHFTYVFILCIIYNCRCIYRKLQNCCFYFVCEVTVSRIQQVKCKVRDMVFNATLNIMSIRQNNTSQS